MDGEGPDPGRDAPDDHDGRDETPLRGWIPPDDRLWRHPSEMVAGRPGGAGTTRKKALGGRELGEAGT